MCPAVAAMGYAMLTKQECKEYVRYATPSCFVACHIDPKLYFRQNILSGKPFVLDLVLPKSAKIPKHSGYLYYIDGYKK